MGDKHSRRSSCDVAVVGAGPAGLATARELQREGHNVTVFEKMPDIGGVWLEDQLTHSDQDGMGFQRREVHSSLYHSLRTNLPRELMGFSDFPFLPKYMQGRSVDARRFPHHTEVQQYLYAFVDHYNIRPLVRFNTLVTSIRPSAGSTAEYSDRKTNWQVVTVSAAAAGSGKVEETEGVYDAVVVANGHYSVPRIAQLDGLDTFPARIEHSHLYRRPEPYSGKRVLLVGTHTSGEDLAWDLAPCAAQVVMSGKKWIKDELARMVAPFGKKGNMLRRPWVSKLHEDGKVEFEDGSCVYDIDVVMFCTGYHNCVPFLDQSIVDSSEGYFRPIFQHMLHPQYGASLSFVGLPATVATFPQFEIQARAVARWLSGRVLTPSQAEMEEWTENFYRTIQEAGVAGRHVHKQGGAQFAYNEAVAAMSEAPPPPPWRKALWDSTMALWAKYAPNEYRDRWDDAESIAMAHSDIHNVPVPVASGV